MLTEILDYRTGVTIAHLLGVIIGAGGAFASDMMFFSSVKDEILSKTELRFLKLGSAMVWVGLLIIIISGALLFLTSPEGYLASSKFLAKMTIVGIITMNGAIFHFYHMPHFVRHAGMHFPSSEIFVRRSPWIMISGALSVSSWMSAFILGSLRSLPFSYTQIIGAYGLIISVAIISALLLRTRILRLTSKANTVTSASV